MKFDPSNADEKAKITSIDIAGKGFTDARPDLLMGFMGVKELNANENHLELHQLANLTGLEVLTLACNALRQLQSLHDYDFPFLRVLDLSFNRLGNTALASLAALQRLEVLDLMSNEITAVPLDSICINRGIY